MNLISYVFGLVMFFSPPSFGSEEALSVVKKLIDESFAISQLPDSEQMNGNAQQKGFCDLFDEAIDGPLMAQLAAGPLWASTKEESARRNFLKAGKTYISNFVKQALNNLSADDKIQLTLGEITEKFVRVKVQNDSKSVDMTMVVQNKGIQSRILDAITAAGSVLKLTKGQFEAASGGTLQSLTENLNAWFHSEGVQGCD